MARFLSRSTRQLYSSRCILQPQHVVPVRFYAQEATPKAPNEMMKGIFLGVKNKLETAIGDLRNKMKIAYDVAMILVPIEGVGLFDSMRLKFVICRIANNCRSYDPSKPGFETMLMDAVEKLDEEAKKIFGMEMDKYTREDVYEFMRLFFTAMWRMKGIQDARTHILILLDTWVGDSPARPDVEASLMDAIDKVEEEIKKPLMVNDKKGMNLLRQEMTKRGLN